jgi:phosphomevalonate kinase
MVDAMGFDITGKAPGKILWLGGYSILERPNIGFVTAVDAYVSANVKSIDGNLIVIDAPQLKARASGTIDLDSGVLSIEVPKELVLLKTAIEVASRYVAGLGIRLQGMQITTRNDPAFSYTITEGKIAKSGLGSSAAVTVASVGTVLKAYGVDTSADDALHKLSQTAHSIATGKVGSGFDIAAATHGTILYTRYSPGIVKDFPAAYQNSELQGLIKRNWDCVIEKFNLPGRFNLMFANFVGEGMITTAAVGSVSKFKEKEPARYKELVDAINAENVKAVQALRAMSKGENIDSSMNAFKDAFNKGRILTKQLGILSDVSVEDDDLTRLIEESVENGAFVAKLPGAGGRDSIAALILDEQSRRRLEDFWSKRKEIQILKINAEEGGFRA